MFTGAIGAGIGAGLQNATKMAKHPMTRYQDQMNQQMKMGGKEYYDSGPQPPM